MAGVFLAAILSGEKQSNETKEFICSEQHGALDTLFRNYHNADRAERPKLIRNIVIRLNTIPTNTEALHPRAMALIASRMDERFKNGSWKNDSWLPRKNYTPSAELIRDLRRLCREPS